MKPVGPKKLPYNGGVPRHWNCRSAEIPITYTWEELGIEGIGETRAVVEGGQRASMFGPTTARSFDQWLKSRSPAEMDSILGSQRLGAAFRAGKIDSVKQLVDAAGRPYNLGELQELGLVGPRWRGANTWGAFGSLEELRKAIIDDVNDPNGDLARMNDRIEELAGSLVDQDIARANHYSGDVPLPPDELADLEAEIKSVKAEIARLKKEERLYVAKKYLYDITPGKANLAGQITAESGLSKVAREAMEEGVDVFSNLIGSGTHLERRFRTSIEGAYWHGVNDIEDPSMTYAQKWHTGRGRPKMTFSMSKGNSDFKGGGHAGFIRIGDPTYKDVVHELGHWYESTSSNKMREIVRFLKRRTGDEWGSPTPYLQTPHWKAEYAREITRFLESYQGAVYAGGADWKRPCLTEFLSKGLDIMVSNPAELIRQDPDTFDFILRLLAGRL